MIRRRKIVKAGLNLLAGMMLIAATALPASAKTVAVVPIAPMAWMLEQLAQDQVQILTLIPPGASPHSYEITPRQMGELAGADIFFTLNLPLERQLLARLQAGRPQLKVIDLNRGIVPRYFTVAEQEFEHHDAEPRHHHDEHALPDPHTWLNPLNAIIQAENMAAALPQQVDALSLQKLRQSLQQLDNRLHTALAPCQGQSFLVYHPSFGYLAQRYGLKQVAVEMEGKEPTPRRLARLVDQARTHGIKIIFVQPQFPQAAVQRLAEEIQGSVLVLDPLAYDYIANLQAMAENLQKGF